MTICLMPASVQIAQEFPAIPTAHNDDKQSLRMAPVAPATAYQKALSQLAIPTGFAPLHWPAAYSHDQLH